MVKNLTEGKPLNLLFFFALPMVAGNLFQQLYNMVDTAVAVSYTHLSGLLPGTEHLLQPGSILVLPHIDL